MAHTIEVQDEAVTCERCGATYAGAHLCFGEETLAKNSNPIADAIRDLAAALREHTAAMRDYRPPDLYGPRGTEIRRDR